MKKTKNIFIIISLIILCLTGFSFATVPEFKPENMEQETTENTEKVVYMSSEKVEKNKEFYLVLNLSKISFSKFKVEITNTSKLSADEVTSGVSSLSTNSVATSFEVDKTSINLEKLGIAYTAPKEACVINFNVKITSLDETEEDLKAEQLTLKTELSNLNSNLETLNETLKGLETDFETAKTEGLEADSEIYKDFENQIAEAKAGIEKVKTEISSKDKENQELTNKIANFTALTLEEEVEIEVAQELSSGETEKLEFDKEDMFKMEEKNKEMTKNMEDMMSKMGDLENNLKDANDTISSLTKTVTYQGSQNNYLESLSIDGVEFNSSFKKTTTNYFATVNKDVTKVTVKATPEDSSAIVTIYGNTDLKEGQNKILITVTADDESVRTYKIYVKK